MENRKEFERFAALYWGQTTGLGSEPAGIIGISIYTIKRITCIRLRSIESLTDEEYGKIAELTGYFDPKPYIGKNAIDEMFGFDKGYTPIEECVYASMGLQIYDYLRSIGIAVPFMNYSVEDMVKMGWIKLINA